MRLAVLLTAGCGCSCGQPDGQPHNAYSDRAVESTLAISKMDVDEVVAIYYIYARYIKKKKQRHRFWVHPYLLTRDETEHFETFFEELKQYDDKFFRYTRMSQKSFEELLSILKSNITKADTQFRKCIKPELKLTVVLRYLATGCSFAELHYVFRIGISTIAEIVREVCAAIWNCLKEICLPEPTEVMWLQIAKDFFNRAQFPHCIGACDGKHIRIVAPNMSGSMCFNYKGFFSQVLMAVCDSNFKFVLIDVGAYGRFGDSAVFQNSSFYKKLQENRLNIPEPAPILESNSNAFPYVFVGDEAFALSTTMMRPYPRRDLDLTRKTFIYRLSRARRYVECTFGILDNKWRIFHRPINVNTDLINDIIKSACILHNFVRDRDGYSFEDSLNNPLIDTIARDSVRRNNTTALRYRELFATYFMNEGRVSWQNNYI